MILRHNSLRDLLEILSGTSWKSLTKSVVMSKYNHHYYVPLTGEKSPSRFQHSTRAGARLYVSAKNLWSPLVKALVDVRIFNPQAISYNQLGPEHNSSNVH